MGCQFERINHLDEGLSFKISPDKDTRDTLENVSNKSNSALLNILSWVGLDYGSFIDNDVCKDIDAFSPDDLGSAADLHDKTPWEDTNSDSDSDNRDITDRTMYDKEAIELDDPWANSASSSILTDDNIEDRAIVKSVTLESLYDISTETSNDDEGPEAPADVTVITEEITDSEGVVKQNTIVNSKSSDSIYKSATSSPNPSRHIIGRHQLNKPNL